MTGLPGYHGARGNQGLKLTAMRHMMMPPKSTELPLAGCPKISPVFEADSGLTFKPKFPL